MYGKHDILGNATSMRHLLRPPEVQQEDVVTGEGSDLELFRSTIDPG